MRLTNALVPLLGTAFATAFAAVMAAPAAAQAGSPAPAPAAAAAGPNYHEHVAPILLKHCASCHRPGEVAPFPLLSYADARKRGRNLLQVVEDRYMPPWHPAPGYGSFRNEMRLAEAQITTLRNWVKAGMPEGPPEKAQKPPTFPEGWQLGEPDMVLRTSGAFEVPAGGRDVYRNFAIPVGLAEDKWLTAIEIRPGSRAVLHHVLVFLDERREGQQLDGKDGKPGFGGMRLQNAPLIATWAVGGMPEHLPEGLAIKLPKGSDLVLQSHLHPSGKKEKEQTTIGLHFADKPPTRTLVSIQLPPLFGATAGLDIPAGEKDYKLQDRLELPCDVDAVQIGGHAHQLCTSVKMFAESKDGTEVPLLHIPEWDFDWQNTYTFRELVRIPKGATLRAELRYDNSAANPNNPNKPPKRVRWGRETNDEMGSVTLLVVPADEKDLDALLAAVGGKNAERAIARAEKVVDEQFDTFDKNRDGKLAKDELPRQMRMFFDGLDKDGDGGLTREEAKGVTELLKQFGAGFGGQPSGPGAPGGLPGGVPGFPGSGGGGGGSGGDAGGGRRRRGNNGGGAGGGSGGE
jgi:mono/diheme cytochrome c family protein